MKRISLLMLMVIVSTVNLFAQYNSTIIEIEQPVWEEVIAPNEGPDLTKFAEGNGKMWTIEKNGVLLFSDDGGQNWEPRYGNVASSNQQIFAGEFGLILTQLGEVQVGSSYSTDYDFYRSEDNGASFTKTEASIIASSNTTHGSTSSRGIYQKSPTELVQIQYAQIIGGPYVNLRSSIDGGDSWDFISIYSDYNFDAMSSGSDMRFDIHDDSISTLIQREDSLWFLNVYTNDYEHPAIDSFFLPEQISVGNFHNNNGQLLLVSNDRRLFLSEDLGQTWTIYFDSLNSPLPGRITFGNEEIYAQSDSQLFSIRYDDLNNAELIFEYTPGHPLTHAESSVGTIASTSEGIFLRETIGVPFNLIGNGLPGFIEDFKTAGAVLWSKTNFWYRSDDDGLTWSLAPLEVLENSRILTDFNDVFLLEKDNQIYQSVDNGHTWESVLTFQGTVEIVEHENGIFLYDRFQIYFSEDGINFTETIHLPGSGKFVWYEDHLLYFNDNQRYRSDDNGLNWEVPEPSQGLNADRIENNNGQLLSIRNTSCCAFIRQSNDGGYSWIQQTDLHPIIFPYYDISPIYVGNHGDIRVFINLTGTAITADNGETWAKLETPFRFRTNFGGFQNDFIRGPKKLGQKAEFLYGIGETNGLFRTSYSFLKDQLPDSVIVKNQITGHLYRDRNDNCELDALDSPITGKVIEVGEQYLRTDDQGWYGLFYDFNNSEVPYYTDSIRHTEHHCENNYEGVFQINQNQNTDTLDIAFYPIPDIIDGGITAWTTGVFRPGGTPQISIKITNHGSVDLVDEQIIFNYDSSKQNINTNSAGTALGNNQWQIPVSLAPETSGTFIIRLNINTSITIDDALTYSIELPVINDAHPNDNQISITENIVASHDPNDKTAYENTTLPYTQNDFIYRIRFQNTGNDTAFKVIILDTLPPELDILTLEMLEASHPYELKIQYPVLRWTLRDILLPDSTTNEPESHGHLFFKIKTKDDLAIADTIKNSAAIYFDYNDPVITEEAITIIEKENRETNQYLSICVGEEVNGTTILMDTTIINIDTTSQIYDIITTSVIEVEPTYYLDSLITLHPGDTILGVPVFSDTMMVYQGVTTEGCDSIINYQITLLTTNTLGLDQLLFSATVQPNPTVGEAILILDAIESERIDIDLYHLTGKKIKSIVDDQVIAAGRQEFSLDLDELPSGVYWLRIRTEKGERGLRVVRM